MAADLPAASAAFERLGKVASLRADLFQLLAIGYFHPTMDLAEKLSDGTFRAEIIGAVAEYAKLLPSVDERDSLTASAHSIGLDELASESEALYHELAVEYAWLFIGMPSPVVSPYESIHVDSEPDAPALLVVGPSARAVLASYREAGLNMLEGLNEPPDHIATELEFAYYLGTREAAAWGEGDTAEAEKWRGLQVTFIREHLAKWGVQFAEQVRDISTVGFYRELSVLASDFLALEKESAQ